MPGSAATARGRVWNLVFLPVVLFVAGLLFATSAHTSSGTDLRGGRVNELRQLITARTSDVHEAERIVAGLHDQIDTANENHAKTTARLRKPQAVADGLKIPAGLQAVAGPGLTVRLDDAPNTDSGSLPAGAGVDDVVVHQQDVQAVVNALWAGGAEAMTIMSQRVIATTAVRCVGNTLYLNGREYSPPFTIKVIGDRNLMRASLNQSPGVQAFQDAAIRWGLGYAVTDEGGKLSLPAYTEPPSLAYATHPSR
ncbi:MAG: hypothetical protein JWO79_584 [Actinomycetia bacterium]|nr:hypothetical protein [Actinomycetes bacterium]MDQ1659515.1 hypothetical protein [Cryptosporangiaceae bacterium]